MISWRGRWLRATLHLRMHSQLAGFLFGLSVAVVSAWSWRHKILDEVVGSLLVGVGAAIIAAAIFAYFSPFNEPAFRRFLGLRIDNVWPSRGDIDESEWVDRLHSAEEKCFLLGIAHGGWCEDDGFLPTLHKRLEHGLLFKMYFLDPTCTAADLRAIEEQRKKKPDTRKKIRKSIKTMWEFRQGLEAGLKDRLKLYAYKCTPSCGLTWIDKTMLVTHYLAGLPDKTAPALLLAPPESGVKDSLYDTYAENLEEIQNMSILLEDENFQQFLPVETVEQRGAGLDATRPPAKSTEEDAGSKGE